MHAIAIGSSDVGRKRSRNEDRFIVDNDLGLFVVADGMGGHAGGERAAELAVETVERIVRGRRATLASVADGHEDPSVLRTIADEAIQAASRAVWDEATSDDGVSGMGCTVTLILAADGKIALGHVGDTRCYLWRSGEVHRLTSDHTMAAELVKIGAIRPDQAATHAYAHVLSRAVGTQEAVTVDTLLVDALEGDRFLLCSDGLSNYATDTEALASRLGAPDFEGVSDALVSFANDAGGGDNITAVVLRLDVDGPERDVEVSLGEEVRVRLDALSSVFLFDDLSLAKLSRVLEICDVVEIDADMEILRRGEALGGLTVVADGVVEVIRDDQVVAELGAGDHVGASALLRTRPARSTLRARTDSKLLNLDGAVFRGLTRRRPWLGVELLERLGSRLASELDQASLEAGVSSKTRGRFDGLISM